MLLSLSIKDLVLIDNLHLEVEGGLSVLTGETGAGKSILLDALGLALGVRGDVSLIRQGADQAIVSAEFYIKDNPVIAQLLIDHGLIEEGAQPPTTIMFRRILSGANNNTARSRAFINDQMVSIGLLHHLGETILEIHGQFDRLLDPNSYRNLLDEFAKAIPLREAVQKNYQDWQEAHHQWQEAEKNLMNLRQNEEFIKQQLQELKKLNLQPHEEENLLREREELAHVGKLTEAIRDTNGHLQGSSLESALHAAIKSLQRVQGLGDGKVDAAVAALEKATIEIIEANAQIQDLVDQLANHPQQLQKIDERLYAIRSAARKYGIIGDGLSDLLQKRTEELASLDHATDKLELLQKETTRTRQVYYDAAKELHRARFDTAQVLQQAVMDELPSLMLPQAQFAVHIIEQPEAQWGETGIDKVDFLVAMNKGQEFCSLSKTASGGELARFMLVLKVVLASRSSIPTIIFDEIDTGVGGAVAAAIGERLAKLAEQVQILSITHSPQLAAYAKAHYLVYKEDLGTFMRTSVKCLNHEERKNELARMLSGSEVTVEAQAAALRLLSAK